ncbi:hypothetical protein PR048_020167 [Dryococelus australis]|uniref:Uncharacterized protein n=1 Tax=Dryococelus australis TaxID=614101 RepID=A0ABQ9H5I9_9NEOP|nr:hypothetical protein PR048_020167 [Dryococelus australis]
MDDYLHGYILEADLEYPLKLHKLHNDLPFCPENKVVQKTHQSKILTTLYKKIVELPQDTSVLLGVQVKTEKEPMALNKIIDRCIWKVGNLLKFDVHSSLCNGHVYELCVNFRPNTDRIAENLAMMIMGFCTNELGTHGLGFIEPLMTTPPPAHEQAKVKRPADEECDNEDVPSEPPPPLSPSSSSSSELDGDNRGDGDVILRTQSDNDDGCCYYDSDEILQTISDNDDGGNYDGDVDLRTVSGENVGDMDLQTVSRRPETMSDSLLEDIESFNVVTEVGENDPLLCDLDQNVQNVFIVLDDLREHHLRQELIGLAEGYNNFISPCYEHRSCTLQNGIRRKKEFLKLHAIHGCINLDDEQRSALQVGWCAFLHLLETHMYRLSIPPEFLFDHLFHSCNQREAQFLDELVKLIHVDHGPVGVIETAVHEIWHNRNSAGYDLNSPNIRIIKHCTIGLIYPGLAIIIPEGYLGKIRECLHKDRLIVIQENMEVIPTVGIKMNRTNHIVPTKSHGKRDFGLSSAEEFATTHDLFSFDLLEFSLLDDVIIEDCDTTFFAYWVVVFSWRSKPFEVVLFSGIKTADMSGFISSDRHQSNSANIYIEDFRGFVREDFLELVYQRLRRHYIMANVICYISSSETDRIRGQLVQEQSARAR